MTCSSSPSSSAAEVASRGLEAAQQVGGGDPDAWDSAAKAWRDLGCLHRAGYASWRQAQALLDAGQSAAAAVALRAAVADGHAPLLAQIRALPGGPGSRSAPRGRPVASPSAEAQALALFGLTSREVAVLRLLATGRTNAQIGAELYISPKTVGVHVRNILRKLGVSGRGRVQAAALAERAGLLLPQAALNSPRRNPKDPRARALGVFPIRAADPSASLDGWHGLGESARAEILE